MSFMWNMFCYISLAQIKELDVAFRERKRDRRRELRETFSTRAAGVRIRLLLSQRLALSGRRSPKSALGDHQSLAATQTPIEKCQGTSRVLSTCFHCTENHHSPNGRLVSQCGQKSVSVCQQKNSNCHKSLSQVPSDALRTRNMIRSTVKSKQQQDMTWVLQCLSSHCPKD